MTSEEKTQELLSAKIKYLQKEIHEKIKDIVITRLLNQIELIYKELEQVKKENVILKDDLTYVLKRVLLHKDEFSNNRYLTHHNSNINSNINGNTSFFKVKSKSNINGSINYNDISSNSILKPSKDYFNLNNSVEEDINFNNYSTIQMKPNNIDQKIDSYLNCLYRHNFVNDNIVGALGKYNLNKNQSFYEELFPSKSPNTIRVGTVNPNSYKKIEKLIKKSINSESGNKITLKGKSNSVKKFILLDGYGHKKGSDKKDNRGKKLTKKNIEISKNHGSIVTTHKDIPITMASSPINKFNRIKQITIKSIDSNTNSNNKNKNYNKQKPTNSKRSPFLNNKF